MRKFGVLIVTVAWIVATPAAADEITIAENGEAKAVIVVARDATPPQRHAADELVLFLGKVTGARFKLVHERDAAKANLCVGPGAAKAADPGLSVDGLGDEGIVIRTVGKDLILAGGEPRGTLYAAYTFLEDHVGCRWWTSTASTIPRKLTLRVGPLDVRYVPKLECRTTDCPDANEADYSVRNKYNGHHHRLFFDDGLHNPHEDRLRGGRKFAYIKSDKWGCHGMWTLIPPEIYFKEHPEWFSMVNGKRTAKLWMAAHCLSNEDMRKQMVENALLAIIWHPIATIFSVSQVDDGGLKANCECSKCAAIEKEEGSPAGLLLRFVNAVAADLEKHYPKMVVSTLAYHYNQKPPKITKPRHNVVVRLSNIKCSFSVPLSHERNKPFRDDLVAWSKICDRLYVWDYVANFGKPMLPHPNLRVLAPNVRFLVAHNVKGIFAEALVAPGMEMAELRSWVLAKLFWNPDLDGDKLVEEFALGYYGPAGKHVLAYINLLHDAVEASDDYLGLGSPADAKFLSFDNLVKARAHLDAAEAAVAQDARLLRLVQRFRLHVTYAFLLNWDGLRKQAEAAKADWPLSESHYEACEQFKRNARRLGNNLTIGGGPIPMPRPKP